MSKSPSLRRIKADIRELSVDPSDQYVAAPLEHDMFEWHFTIRGAPDTDFAGGVYHGRILLPPEYPFKPPNIVFLTPSGRFECGVKVCLSFSAHHPELWQPAWGIRLILEALISFLPTPADGAIGALDWTPEERRKLAKESVKFRCPHCCAEGETCADLLPELKATGDGDAKNKTKFQEEIEKLKMMQFHNHAVEEKEKADDGKQEDSAKSNSAECTAAEERNPPDLPENDDDAATAAAKPPSDFPLAEGQKPAEMKSNDAPKAAAPVSEPNVSPPEASSQSAADNTDTTTETADVPPLPPPIPANANARAITDTPDDPAAAILAADQAALDNNNAPIVSDSVLNTMIGFFAVIVIVLLRQAQSLVDELHGLAEEI